MIYIDLPRKMMENMVENANGLVNYCNFPRNADPFLCISEDKAEKMFLQAAVWQSRAWLRSLGHWGIGKSGDERKITEIDIG